MASSVPREAQQPVCVCANELGDVKDRGEYRQAAGAIAEAIALASIRITPWALS